MANRVKAQWLRLTEETNSLDYLEKTHLFIKQTEKDHTAWKWVILSLHGALYGFAICALKGTDPERVIDFKNRHKTTQDLGTLPFPIMQKKFPSGIRIRYNNQKKQLIFNGSMSDNARRKLLKLSNDRNFHKAINELYINSRRLISFKEAMKRCQDDRYMQMTIMSNKLKLSNEQKISLSELNNEFRDNIEHYIPKSWIIEIHGMPQISIDVLDIIRFLAIEAGNYTHLKPSQVRRVKSLIFQSKKFLKKSKLWKEVN
jgi:hypothetical protein